MQNNCAFTPQKISYRDPFFSAKFYLKTRAKNEWSNATFLPEADFMKTRLREFHSYPIIDLRSAKERLIAGRKKCGDI